MELGLFEALKESAPWDFLTKPKLNCLGENICIGLIELTLTFNILLIRRIVNICMYVCMYVYTEFTLFPLVLYP